MKKGIVILISVLAVLATFGLLLYSLQLKPDFVPLSEVSTHVGKTVTTEGFLRDCIFAENYVKGRISDESGRNVIGLYAVQDAFEEIKKLNPMPGSKMRLTGEVKEYAGQIEIYLSQSNAIEILQSPENLVVSISALLETPERFEGFYLTTHGQIVSINLLKNSSTGMLIATQIEISDNGYVLTCLAYNKNVQQDCSGKMLEKGLGVEIFGQFKYNAHYGRWNLVFEDEQSIRVL